MTDGETLGVYAEKAEDYAARFSGAPAQSLIDFVEAVHTGGTVLDLGCGPGNASRYMAHHGLVCHAWDASPEMIALADAPNVQTRVAAFEALTETAAFDGIYANFSLLHAPRTSLAGHLAAIAQALKPGGVLHLGLKTGTGERRDRLGRFYAYHTPEELTQHLNSVGLTPVWSVEGAEPGLAGPVEPFILIRALKHG